MRGRPPGSRNKNPKSDSVSKDEKALRRKRHQRKLEAAVTLDKFLTAEAKRVKRAAKRAGTTGNPDALPFLYQGTQAKLLGESFARVAKRLKRRR